MTQALTFDQHYVAEPNQHPLRAGWPDPYGIERDPSLIRKVVEFMFYGIILNAFFAARQGSQLFPHMAGVLNTITGTFCFFVVLFQREKLPVSVVFAILINLGANFSQIVGNGELPLLGEGLALLVHFFTWQICLCYLVQDRRAQKRILLFFCFLLILLFGIGAETTGAHGAVKRTQISEEIGGNFTNANSLAYAAGLFCVGCLFWSLRAVRSMRPVLWFIAAFLFYITIMTVSRVGIALMFGGLFMVMLAIMLGRGTRVGGVILVAVSVLALTQLAFVFSPLVDAFNQRVRGEYDSTMSRLNLYSWQTVSDLISTLFVGRGPSNAENSSTGIAAHNTFVYLHMAFGGITAWCFLSWMIVLCTRTWRMIRERAYPWDTLIMVAGFLLMILGEHMTNNTGFTEFSALYGVAVIEKYTTPFSRRNIVARQYARPMEMPVAPYSLQGAI